MNESVKLYIPLNQQYIKVPDDEDIEDAAVVTQQKFIDQGIITWLIYTKGD